MKRRALVARLIAADATLTCIACGRLRCEHSVVLKGAGRTTICGIHARCLLLTARAAALR